MSVNNKPLLTRHVLSNHILSTQKKEKKKTHITQVYPAAGPATSSTTLVRRPSGTPRVRIPLAASTPQRGPPGARKGLCRRLQVLVEMSIGL